MTQPTLFEALFESMDTAQEKVLLILQLRGAELLTHEQAMALLHGEDGDGDSPTS